MLVEQIFAKAPVEYRLKYYRHGFYTVVDKTKKLGCGEKGFRKAVRHLEYAYKWFNKLRGVLFLAAQMDDDDSLAPLSKKYRLTEEEAKDLPQRLTEFIETLDEELSKCKQPARRVLLEKYKKQVEKYHQNLLVPIITITDDDVKIKMVLPRTNNCLESFFRYIKCLLRRLTGRSKLSKEFQSVGALLRDPLIFNNNFIRLMLATLI